jgi:hypothetical protein
MDVSHAADEFLKQLDWEEIDQFRIIVDFYFLKNV